MNAIIILVAVNVVVVDGVGVSVFVGVAVNVVVVDGVGVSVGVAVKVVVGVGVKPSIHPPQKESSTSEIVIPPD